MIEGRVDTRDAELDDLRKEMSALKLKLAHAELELTHAKSEATKAVSGLRRTLSPLYQSLQALFGDIDAVAPGDFNDAPSAASAAKSTSAVWDAWKSKLRKNCGRIIDALLVHGELNATQIAITTGIDRSNVPKSIYKINQAGLINKNGGNYSLKAIR